MSRNRKHKFSWNETVKICAFEYPMNATEALRACNSWFLMSVCFLESILVWSQLERSSQSNLQIILFDATRSHVARKSQSVVVTNEWHIKRSQRVMHQLFFKILVYMQILTAFLPISFLGISFLLQRSSTHH